MWLSRKVNKAWQNAKYELMILEKGGGGDCLFHCLKCVLNQLSEKEEKAEEFTMKNVRIMLAESITENNIAQFYAKSVEGSEHFHDDVWPTWSRKHMKNGKDFVHYLETHAFNRGVFYRHVVRKIKQSGFAYQGNQCTLEWMVEHCPELSKQKLRFLVFHEYGPWATQTVPTFNDPENPGVYCLLFNYKNACHWRLAAVAGISDEDEGDDEESKLWSCVNENAKDWLLLKSGQSASE